jgi:nucleoside-diphosphate-sugar epimerase
MPSPSKVQIFGGKGFVGSAFVEKCMDKETSCIVNDRDDYKVKAYDIVYMISTVTNYHVKENPYIDIETNLLTLMKVLEQCKNDSHITFNFISSWFVYGETEMPAHEDSYCKPNGFYSITKRCAEQLVISYCETFNIKYRILRLANVAGYGDKKASPQKNALQHMINELKAGRDVNVYDGGNLYRDYIHVNDVADAIYLIMEKGEVNTIYNVGNGKPLLFKDMIEYAKSQIGGEGKLNSIEIPQFHKTVQVRSMWMLSDKLKSLGYEPKYDMEHIIDDMIR